MKHQVCIAAVFVASCSVSGQVAWDESVQGDLSGVPGAPTPIVFGLGSNLIHGSVNGSPDVRDYITFTIPSGQALGGLMLLKYEDASGGAGNTGFNAINAGPTSFIPDPLTAGNFLGANHVESAFVGTDLLPGLAAATLAGTGFTTPLVPGTYSYLLQQTSLNLTFYSLDFVIIPAPWASTALAAGLLAARRRRY